MATMVTSVTMVPGDYDILWALSSYMAVRAIACIRCLSLDVLWFRPGFISMWMYKSCVLVWGFSPPYSLACGTSLSDVLERSPALMLSLYMVYCRWFILVIDIVICLPFCLCNIVILPGLHNGVGSGQEMLTTYQVSPGGFIVCIR